MLEGTDGKVYHVYRTPEMEEQRSQQGLQTNSFIRLRKLSTVRGPLVEPKDMGDSEAILSNKYYFREMAREMTKRGVTPIRTTAGMDGSDDIRERSLTPHSHSNRRRRKNANGAEAEVWAASSSTARSSMALLIRQLSNAARPLGSSYFDSKFSHLVNQRGSR